MPRADDRPIEVFYSYSHRDEEYRNKLGEHLSVLRRAGLITDWHDRDIDAGTAWQEEIDRHLVSADIVLLLVSASFIASDYCWGDEMTKALARHRDGKTRVIPVILHSCGWLRTPLSVLQGVPRDNRAISLWSNEHAAFDHVVSEITKVVDDLRGRRTVEPKSSPPHPDPLPPGEGDRAEAAGTPRPPAREEGTRDSGRVKETPPDSLSRRERDGVRARLKGGVYIGVGGLILAGGVWVLSWLRYHDHPPPPPDGPMVFAIQGGKTIAEYPQRPGCLYEVHVEKQANGALQACWTFAPAECVTAAWMTQRTAGIDLKSGMPVYASLTPTRDRWAAGTLKSVISGKCYVRLDEDLACGGGQPELSVGCEAVIAR
jgi:TIR domain-containing protein